MSVESRFELNEPTDQFPFANTLSVKHSRTDRVVLHWRVPPEDNAPGWEWKLYDSYEQAHWQDTSGGVYSPGQRVDPDVLKAAGFSDYVVDGLREGFRYPMKQLPKISQLDNYKSFLQAGEASDADVQRLLSSGYIEGPLPYVPRLVTPLGMIIKPGFIPGTLKYRTVVDATRSGLNESMEDMYVKLDTMKDALQKVQPGSWLVKFDLSDAFLMFPISGTQCDFLGFRDRKGDLYRYRFAPFGVKLSPMICQTFAEELKLYVSANGLKHVTRKLDNGEDNPAASYEGFSCAACYLDDFM